MDQVLYYALIQRPASVKYEMPRRPKFENRCIYAYVPSKNRKKSYFGAVRNYSRAPSRLLVGPSYVFSFSLATSRNKHFQNVSNSMPAYRGYKSESLVRIHLGKEYQYDKLFSCYINNTLRTQKTPLEIKRIVRHRNL